MNTTLIKPTMAPASRADFSGQTTKIKEFLGKASSRQYVNQKMWTGVPLFLGDLLALSTCFWFAWVLSTFLGTPPLFASGGVFFTLVGGLIVVFAAMGLYNGGGMHPVFEFRQCSMSVSIVYALVGVASLNSGAALSTIISFPLVLLAIPAWRAFLRRSMVQKPWWGVRCLVFDCDRRVNELYNQHLKNTHNGLRPIGFLQSGLPSDCEEDLKQFYLGEATNAANESIRKQAFCALVHRRGRPDHEIYNFINAQLSSFTRVIIVPDDHRLPTLWSLGSAGGISLEDRLTRPSAQLLKRTMDLTLSICGLIALAPLLLFIMAWIKITSPGPLFFGHERIGKHGKRFKAWKFRSMVTNANEVLEKTLAENPEMRAEWEATYKLQKDPRITPPGRLLRKTSLDELPQLWNVIKGEMSLVGPRPIVVGEIERYEETFESYLRVIPGITGFWQVSGRNLTSYNRRVELDGYYVRNWSMWFDIYILGRTIKTVLFREGAF